ncbi:hypothetical protein [Cytobacillus massiliigabonensis]|uniref:hypothetical protein n=1 Tax=Cytobacillus massiliigabonensis TaxID=1871011 RepID=UPI000C85AE76|nr:hypothetical protein [Cytobacillus massiliigabonensis]
MKRLTNEQLNAIRERAESAAEGPWKVGKRSPNGLENVGCKGLLIAQVCRYDDAELNRNTAEFIAHAREDVPKLLEYITELKTEIIRLSEAEDLLSEAHDVMNDVHLYDTDLYREISRYFYGEDDE